MAANARFALNHMCAPQMAPEPFFSLAARVGVAAVEIRNDLAGNAILDGTAPAVLRELAHGQGLRIASINALQRFNDWNEARRDEAAALIAYAQGCGAEALVLVPTNDGSGRGNGERQANLRIALKELRPLLTQAGITGLVEPLGFETCSLRLKSEAADAIGSIDPSGTFALVHDTFHHHLAGEQTIYPAMTGLVHVSGITDPALSLPRMRDEHRVLVDRGDRLGNVDQVRALLAGGYRGLVSFEPFAPSIHALEDIPDALSGSMHLMESELARVAA